MDHLLIFGPSWAQNTILPTRLEKEQRVGEGCRKKKGGKGKIAKGKGLEKRGRSEEGTRESELGGEKARWQGIFQEFSGKSSLSLIHFFPFDALLQPMTSFW